MSPSATRRRARAEIAGALDEFEPRSTSFPFLDSFFCVDREGRALVGHGTTPPAELDGARVGVLERILYDGGSLDQLVDEARALLPERSEDDLRESIVAAAQQPGNLLRIATLELAPRYDAVFLCQGYGGVYVQAIEIWKRLSRRWSILLIAPVEPPSEVPPDLRARMLIYERLHDAGVIPSYFAYVQIVRSVLRTLRYDLLYLEHRSQSLYAFDVIVEGRAATIIHDDGFYDALYYSGAASRAELTEPRRRRILVEVFNSLRYNVPDFYGLGASPRNNRHVMEAGWFALRAADENWAYARPANRLMEGIYEEARGTFRFVPPMIDESLARDDLEREDDRVLFTTTMHNLLRKGIVELCRAMRLLPERIRARVVLGRPELLPDYIDEQRYRLDVSGYVPKDELVRLYHTCSVNVRVARDESSSLSTMEAMSCGQPVITSPIAQQNLPILEDGVTCLVVAPGDPPRKLAAAIQRLCEDRELRERLGRAARERVAEYTLERQLPLLTRHLRGSA